MARDESQGDHSSSDTSQSRKRQAQDDYPAPSSWAFMGGWKGEHNAYPPPQTRPRKSQPSPKRVCHAKAPVPSHYLVGIPPVARHNLEHFGDDHWRGMKEKEEVVYIVDPHYLERHPDIRPGMRAQLLDWLQEVAANFYVHRQTFQAAVNFIDRYLSRTTSFPPGQLQLLAVSALFAAAKAEEIYPPTVAELAETTAGSCASRDIIDFERHLLKLLEWNMWPPTSQAWTHNFLLRLEIMNESKQQRFSAMGSSKRLPKDSNSMVSNNSNRSRSNCDIRLLESAASLMDLALLDICSLHFLPSSLAAASLYILLPRASHGDLAQCTGTSPNDTMMMNCMEYLRFISQGLDLSNTSSLPVSPRLTVARRLIPKWDRPNLQCYRPKALSHLSRRVEDLGCLAPDEVPSFLRYKEFGGRHDKVISRPPQEMMETDDEDDDDDGGSDDEEEEEEEEEDKENQDEKTEEVYGVSKVARRFTMGETWYQCDGVSIWRLDSIIEEMDGGITEGESQSSWGLLTSDTDTSNLTFMDSENSEGLLGFSDTVCLEANECL